MLSEQRKHSLMMALAYANQFFREGTNELNGAGPERSNIAANQLRAALFHLDETSVPEVIAWPV